MVAVCAGRVEVRTPSARMASHSTAPPARTDGPAHPCRNPAASPRDDTPASFPPAFDSLLRDTEALGLDRLPQSSWPAGHGDRVDALLAELDRRDDFVQVGLSWGSGLRILARRSAAP